MALGGIVRVRHRAVACAILRRPLLGTSRALRQLPLVLEQVLEKVVAPLGGRRGPCHFQAAADGVAAVALPIAIRPAEALRLDRSALGLRTDILAGIGRA